MKLIQMYQNATNWLTNLKDLPLFFFRLILAYGFYIPATMKWGNISGIAEWFGSMGIPLPLLNAYLAATTEMAAVILLPLGLATRIISIPLLFTMVVAIVTVHLGNGFNAGDNGFEIPVYYMLMLFALLTNGAGKFSLDHLISRKIKLQS
ncbi:MAG: DoxX family protein [Bacteroidales bacterium]|nr:DoxX family protein [Bacteroidales bacterium]